MRSLVRVTAPAVLPISLQEAKAASRLEHEDEDALVVAYLSAATDYIDGRDGFLQRALITQTWELKLDAFPDGAITVPLPPLQSVESVSYGGQALDSSAYRVAGIGDRMPGRIAPVGAWPAAQDEIEAVTVRFVAGYGDNSSDVPETIRHAIILLAAHWYENREAATVQQLHDLPFGVEALLGRHREPVYV